MYSAATKCKFIAADIHTTKVCIAKSSGENKRESTECLMLTDKIFYGTLSIDYFLKATRHKHLKFWIP